MVKALRTTPEWKEVLRLSDEIKGLIHQQWTDEELDYLLGNSFLVYGIRCKFYVLFEKELPTIK